MYLKYFIRGTTVKKRLSCSYNICIIHILYNICFRIIIYVSDYNLYFRIITYVSELTTYVTNSNIEKRI